MTVNSDLTNIRTKVRRLTGSPSPLNLSDANIDDYVNTMYLHDLPQHLKLLDLKSTYTFYTEANVDTYSLDQNPSFTSTATQAIYSVEPPVYVAGYEAQYTQDRTEFSRAYPSINNETTQQGDNTAGPFSITVSDVPVLRNQVTISAPSGGSRLLATDDGSGNLTGDVTAGSIDYETGAITNLTFTGIISSSDEITVQTVPFVASRPEFVLFYNNTFTVRPVPDKCYRIDLDAQLYPSALLSSNPFLQAEPNFLWQLLALGASLKVFEDRGDLESYATLEPLFEKERLLCNRRTIDQLRPERASTIYTQQLTGLGNLQQNRF